MTDGEYELICDGINLRVPDDHREELHSILSAAGYYCGHDPAPDLLRYMCLTVYWQAKADDFALAKKQAVLKRMEQEAYCQELFAENEKLNAAIALAINSMDNNDGDGAYNALADIILRQKHAKHSGGKVATDDIEESDFG